MSSLPIHPLPLCASVPLEEALALSWQIRLQRPSELGLSHLEAGILRHVFPLSEPQFSQVQIKHVNTSLTGKVLRENEQVRPQSCGQLGFRGLLQPQPQPQVCKSSLRTAATLPCPGVSQELPISSSKLHRESGISSQTGHSALLGR
jgi:hypothetical protein